MGFRPTITAISFAVRALRRRSTSTSVAGSSLRRLGGAGCSVARGWDDLDMASLLGSGQRGCPVLKIMREGPSRTIEDIAADAGFSSSSQFVKKFKEITGTTPRAWLADQR